MNITNPPLVYKTSFRITPESIITSHSDVPFRSIGRIQVQPAFTLFIGRTNDVTLSLITGDKIKLYNVSELDLKVLLKTLSRAQPGVRIDVLPLFLTGKRLFLPDMVLPQWLGFAVLAVLAVTLLVFLIL